MSPRPCEPTGTTTDLAVALQYSTSQASLLFKIKTKSFMQRGADLSYLSAFPGERELLYPPLTFLQPTGKTMDYVVEAADGAPAAKYTIVEVEPFAS